MVFGNAQIRGGGSKSRDDAVYLSLRISSLKYTWQACLNCVYSIQNSQASSLPVGKQNHHTSNNPKGEYYTAGQIPAASFQRPPWHFLWDMEILIYVYLHSSNFHSSASLLNVHTDYSHSRAPTPHFSEDIWTYKKNGSVWDTFGSAFEKVVQGKILEAVNEPMCNGSWRVRGDIIQERRT